MRSTDPDLALTDSVGWAAPVVAVVDISVALVNIAGFVAALFGNFGAIEGFGLVIVGSAGITGFIGIVAVPVIVVVFIFVGATTALAITGAFATCTISNG